MGKEEGWLQIGFFSVCMMAKFKYPVIWLQLLVLMKNSCKKKKKKKNTRKSTSFISVAHFPLLTLRERERKKKFTNLCWPFGVWIVLTVRWLSAI